MESDLMKNLFKLGNKQISGLFRMKEEIAKNAKSLNRK